MARVKGGYLGGIYDVPKKQPLDSRMLVTKKADLINPSVWKTNGSTTGESGHYNGMIVSVNSDGIYNGVYYLTDRTAITTENYEAYRTALAVGENIDAYFSMWTKLGTLDDLAAIKPTIGLTPVDGTIVIADSDNGDKTIGVAIAPIANNALTAVDGGLFVPAASVKLADNTHGLVMVDGTLTLNLATKDSDGAMSKEDKRILDAIPETYATSEKVAILEETISNLEKSCLWGEI
jgi:hypothetical protein